MQQIVSLIESLQEKGFLKIIEQAELKDQEAKELLTSGYNFVVQLCDKNDENKLFVEGVGETLSKALMQTIELYNGRIENTKIKL